MDNSKTERLLKFVKSPSINLYFENINHEKISINKLEDIDDMLKEIHNKYKDYKILYDTVNGKNYLDDIKNRSEMYPSSIYVYKNPKIIQLYIKAQTGNYLINVEINDNLNYVKDKIEKITKIPKKMQYYMSNSKYLNSEKSFLEYNVDDFTTLQLFVKSN